MTRDLKSVPQIVLQSVKGTEVEIFPFIIFAEESLKSIVSKSLLDAKHFHTTVFNDEKLPL